MTAGTCHIGDCRAVMRKLIADGVKVQCAITSPPYWQLRDYGHPKQIGLERTPERYLARMRGVLRLVRELLTDDGTLWLNMGDSYATGTTAPHRPGRLGFSGRSRGGRDAVNRPGTPIGLKTKDMIGMPWMLALLLRADGWYLRQEIIWNKPTPMPESVTDRCTKAHEHLFLLSKSPRYYFDQAAILEPAVSAKEARYDPGLNGLAGVDRKAGVTTRRFRTPVAGWDTGEGKHSTLEHARVSNHDTWFSPGKSGNKARKSPAERGAPASNQGNVDGSVPWEGIKRNKRSVWTIMREPYPEAHFATFPRALVEPCLLAGSRPGDVVFDPFMGSGTVAEVAETLGRRWLGIELTPEYLDLQRARLQQMNLGL